MSQVPVAQRVENIGDESNQWLAQAGAGLYDGVNRWLGGGPHSDVLVATQKWEKSHPKATKAQEDAALTAIEQQFENRTPRQVFADWWKDVHSSPTSNPILGANLAYQNWAAPPATAHNPHPKGALLLLVQGMRQGANPFAGGIGGDASNAYSQATDDILSYGSVYPLHFGVDVGTTAAGAAALPALVRDAVDAGLVYGSQGLADAGLIGRGTASKAAQAVATPVAQPQAAPPGGEIPHVIYTEIEPGKTPELQQHQYTTDLFNPAAELSTQEHGDYDSGLEAMTKKVAGSGLAEKLTQAARSAGSTLTVNSVEPLNGAYRTADGILKARPNVQIAFTGTPEDGKELVQGVTRGAAQEESIAFRPLTPDEILAGVSGDPEYNLRLPTTLSRDEQTDVANALANIPELQDKRQVYNRR